jgi:hypothetical protein
VFRCLVCRSELSTVDLKLCWPGYRVSFTSSETGTPTATSGGKGLKMGGEPGDAECEALVAATANRFKTVMREFTDRVLTLKERNKETTTDQAALQEGLSQWQAEHKKLLGAAFSDMNRQRFRLEFEVPGGHVKQVLNRATPIII